MVPDVSARVGSEEVGPASDVHPALHWEAFVASARGRASAAIIALGATIALRVFVFAVSLWQNQLISAVQAHEPADQETLVLSDTLTSYGGIGTIVLLLVTGILFVRWLHLTVRITKALGSTSLRWSPGDAVAGFFIPFVSFVRPYHVVRDLHDALAPDAVPAPTATVRASEQTGYRDVEIQTPPEPVRLPHASIGAWWAFFWVGNFASNGALSHTGTTLADVATRNTSLMFVDVCEIISALLAIAVVRAVSARLNERYRRVRYNTVESLAAAGIRID